MDDIIQAVRTSRYDSQQGNAEVLISETTTNRREGRHRHAESIEPATSRRDENEDAVTRTLERPEDVLQTLRDEPSVDTLLAALKSITSAGSSRALSLHNPGPVQAQIINTIVESIIPTFWQALDDPGRALLVASLLSVTGVNAITSKLRLLSEQTNTSPYRERAAISITDLLQVLSRLLQSDLSISCIWDGLHAAVPAQVKRDLMWKEAVSLFGSGKIVSIVARAEDASTSAETAGSTWLSSGEKYAAWIARNISSMLAQSSNPNEAIAFAAPAQLLSNALGLGYPVVLVRTLLELELQRAAQNHDADASLIRLLLGRLLAHVKRRFLEVSLKWLSASFQSMDVPSTSNLTQDDSKVNGIAALLWGFFHDNILRKHTTAFLAEPATPGLISLSVRRACVVAIATAASHELAPLLEKTLAVFGDSLFVKHAPILQQDCLAQTLLLTAGCLYRSNPSAVLLAARSSHHMQGVSNRLEASGSRARWLGMVVGTAISSLVDKPGTKMNFGVDDMETEEATAYMNLVNVRDHVGSLSDLISALDDVKQPTALSRRPKQTPSRRQVGLPVIDGKQTFGPPRPPSLAQTEIQGDRITDLSDEEDRADEDLKPYAKPDSDPEDSDEDATLVNRNKPKPPVYIRTLIAMLRDTESGDRFQMALKHATTLIRRKTNFGREVADHVEELARILTNLQDSFETECFEELRLQALIAVLLSDAPVLAPWLSRQVFIGEYSIAQRCVMLTALGLGGRELAGFKREDELNPLVANTDFPTKRLPGRLHTTYTSPESAHRRLEATSKQLQHSIIQPLALAAADQTTAPLNAVKVRTFSSRMEVERTKRKPAANVLARIAGEAFFFPLIGRFQQDIAAYGQSSVVASTSHVLTTFLKTLAILLHASGPATLSLPQITSELWDLLLSLRVKATGDIAVLEAILFGFLTLLDVSTDKQRIAEERPKQLMETKEWVDMIFERTRGGNIFSQDNDEESRVRTMAAGVLMKANEVIDAYQKQLLGNYSTL